MADAVFGHRVVIVSVFALMTAVMIYAALTGLRIDAGFTKQLPLKHEYMQTFLKHQEEFGGANRVLIAVMARDGNMFTPEFFRALRTATDEVFFIDGVDRARVQSLYTPNVRYTEVVEDGIQAGNVMPADFEPTPEGLAQVRENILKAGIVGRLVANDFSGAIVSARLQDVDPETGKPLNYIRVAHDLETKIRDSPDGWQGRRQVQAGHRAGRRAHDRLRQGRGRHRRRLAVGRGVRRHHRRADAALRLDLRPVASRSR